MLFGLLKNDFYTRLFSKANLCEQREYISYNRTNYISCIKLVNLREKTMYVFNMLKLFLHKEHNISNTKFILQIK